MSFLRTSLLSMASAVAAWLSYRVGGKYAAAEGWYWSIWAMRIQGFRLELLKWGIFEDGI